MELINKFNLGDIVIIHSYERDEDVMTEIIEVLKVESSTFCSKPSYRYNTRRKRNGFDEYVNEVDIKGIVKYFDGYK